MPLELKPHQQKAVDELSNGKILYGGTGVGKSITAMAYFVSKVCNGTYNDWGSMRTPKDVYVITSAKKRNSLDWEKEAIQFGIGRDREASIGNIILTVDSWNNIDKYSGVKDAFFIFDEQRLVGSGAWTKSFIKIAKHNQWILLSATPGDTWLDYIPVFVANGFYKNRTEFKREHVVYNTFSKFPKVDRYIATGKLVRHRNNLLVHMPYERHTVQHSQDILVDYDESTFDKVVNKRWHVYEARPLRDIAELFSVMRRVANSHPSRLNSVRKLMEKHPRLIVFYNFDYELEILRGLQDSSISSETTPFAAMQKKISLDDRKEKTSGSLKITTSNLSNSDSKVDEKKESDPWTYLLSPEGLTRNSLLVRNSSSSSDRFLTSSGSGSKSSLSGIGQIDSVGLQDSELADTSTTHPTSRSSLEMVEKSGERLRTNLKESLSNESNGTPTQVSLSTRKTSSSCLDETKPSTRPWSSFLGETTPSSMVGFTNVDDSNNLSPSKMKSDSVQIAEWNGHKHEEVPDSERWVYLVQYQAGAEAWNCITTDAMVFYSLTYSYKLFHQAHGRIDRMNTPFTDLYYYTLVSKSLIDKAIQRSLRSKKSFNEKNLRI